MSWLIKQGTLDRARVPFINDLLVFMQLSDTHDTPVFKSDTDTPATPFLQSLTLFLFPFDFYNTYTYSNMAASVREPFYSITYIV